MMHIRASTNIVQEIVAMCRSERWQALDCSGGVFLGRATEPNSGLDDWTTYRDRVMGGG